MRLYPSSIRKLHAQSLKTTKYKWEIEKSTNYFLRALAKNIFMVIVLSTDDCNTIAIMLTMMTNDFI